MTQFQKSRPYEVKNQIAAWTRIDMLLAIYDKAIMSIESAQEAQRAGDNIELARGLTVALKSILGLLSGLKPDESPIAANSNRLLHFVLSKIQSRELEDAKKILVNMRQGFEQIHEEATKLEREGKIPPIQQHQPIATVV